MGMQSMEGTSAQIGPKCAGGRRGWTTSCPYAYVPIPAAYEQEQQIGPSMSYDDDAQPPVFLFSSSTLIGHR